MPKNIHTAVVDGVTLKRTSANRTYTHVIVARRNRATAESRARDFAFGSTTASNYRYYTDTLANGRSKHDRDEAMAVRSVADATESLMGASSLEDYQEAVLAREISRIDSDKLLVVGWTGRPDLAEKLLASTRANPFYTDARAVAVTQVVK